MRCTECGQELDETAERCTRCGAEQSPSERRHEHLTTIAFALAACVAVAILIYFVLRWHEYQTLGRIME